MPSGNELLLFLLLLSCYSAYSQRYYINEGEVRFGYQLFNPAYAKHGNNTNENIGGTCKEFLELNEINSCCQNREDDCYMIHYDTRCYCDNFCRREQPDCCPDAISICDGYVEPETTTEALPPGPIISPCEKNGVLYKDGDVIQDNCNQLECLGGHWNLLTNENCLINTDLLVDGGNRGSWIAGNYSKFWGRSLNYGYRHKLGTRLPSIKQTPFNPYTTYSIEALNTPIPSEYDFRRDPDVKNFLRPQPIRDQGECGASWAFSTVDVATDRLVKISKGKHSNQTAYSVQMLISCAILQNNQDGCSPSITGIAWNFLNHLSAEAGIVEENCQPYTNGEKSMAEKCLISANSVGQKKIVCPNNAVKSPYDGSLLLASPSYSLKVNSDADIMREIVINGPVQAVFRVYSDFFMYRSGVYQRTASTREYDHRDPYHSVKILGWGTDENGVDYWLCANSWGSDWGENGYFRIKRGDSEIGQNIFAAWGNGKINGKLLVNNRLNLQKLYQSRS